MYEVTNRTAAPYSSICYITCEWADGSMTRASGVVVGINDVLTAHHVVYDATRGGYATRITVSPGADTSPSITPYGTFTDVGVIYARTPNWDPDGDGLLYAHESQYDMALLGMRSTGVSAAGWLPMSPTATDFSGRMDGYPARGTGLMEEAVYADASTEFGVFDIASSLGPGASGGPLLRSDATGDYVVGVLSSGNSNFTHSAYAGLFGPGNWAWVTNAIEADNSVMPGGSSSVGMPLSGGDAGVITYIGTASPDVMTGTAANENMRGAGGSDAIDGMGGDDTALYLNARDSYRLAHTAGGITVFDTLAGRDGNDDLANVEHVSFSDMTVNLVIGAASNTIAPSELKLLEELYVAFFNRVPEADGLAFWIDQSRAGVSLDYIADSFYSAALQYPSQTGYSSAMSPADFVNTVYRNVLGRADGADAQGLAFWSGALADGSKTRGELVISILGSAHTFKGNATWGWVADLLDNKADVAQHFAVEMGLGYTTAQASIANGMQIADAVTPTDTSAAIALIGVHDTFSTLG